MNNSSPLFPSSSNRMRARDLGITPGILTGPLNAITDVQEVRVGHVTLIEGDDIRTGATAILPHPGNFYQVKTPAGVVVGNGYGKLIEGITMQRQKINDLLAQIRAMRQETLVELTDMTEADFALPTDLKRWDDMRRVLLRFGEHMREHSNQLEDARQKTNTGPTMPQRMLAEAERAWGQLLAATVGLNDEMASQQPTDGGWSALQVLEHILQVEQNYLAAARRARSAQKAGAD